MGCTHGVRLSTDIISQKQHIPIGAQLCGSQSLEVQLKIEKTGLRGTGWQRCSCVNYVLCDKKQQEKPSRL